MGTAICFSFPASIIGAITGLAALFSPWDILIFVLDIIRLITSFLLEMIFFLPAMILGAAIALVALLPPFKALARLFASFRLALAFTLGLVAFLIYFGIDTYTSAISAYFFGTFRYECQSCDFMGYYPTKEEEMHKQAIIQEYWARSVIPPSLQTPCNTGNLDACRLADFEMQLKYRERPTWGDFLYHFIYGSFATLSAIACVAFYTRERPSHRRKKKTSPTIDPEHDGTQSMAGLPSQSNAIPFGE